MDLRNFIFVVTSLAIFEFLLHFIMFFLVNYEYISGKYIKKIEGGSDLAGMAYALVIVYTAPLMILHFIFMIIFVISYWYHLKEKKCCTFKKIWSYISLILSSLLTIAYIIAAINGGNAILIIIDLLLYISYIIHCYLLCKFNYLIAIETTGGVMPTAPNENEQNTNLNEYYVQENI